MLCIKCQREIEDDSLYCRFCGKKQTSTRGTGKRRPRTMPNGAGTVYKVGRSWTAQVRTIRVGKVVSRKKCGFSTRADALAYLPQLKNAPEQAKPFTVAEMWEAVQKTQKWLAISPDKRSHYRTAYNRLGNIADRDIATLKYFELQNIVDSIEGAFYPKRDAKTILQKIYDLAVLQELVPPSKADMVRRIELPSKPLTKQDARTPEEMRAIWADWRETGAPVAGYALIMAYTGMRTGELFAQDISCVNIKGRFLVGGIKTSAGIDRQIPIAEAIVPVLQTLLPNARFGLSCLSESDYYAEWAAMIHRTGVRPLGSYCQRHTCSTRLRELVPAVDDSVVNAILGHSNGNLDDSYTHISLDSKLAAVNRLKMD